MLQPAGHDDGTGNVLNLQKSLHGLKQAPRGWNRSLTVHLLSMDCVRSQSDGALLVDSQVWGTISVIRVLR
jgi:hypothetical protein